MNKQPQPSKSLDIPVRRFITKQLIAVSKNSTIQDAAARMCEFEISSIGITDDGNIIGIVTDKDMKKRALGAGRSPKDPVHEIMTSELVSVDINSTINDVLKLMSKERVKHILITEENKFVGITTLSDLEDLDLQELETLISRD
ncbi:MAG TPA: CBS domain-containing protein [Balneolaceae bacterium]|nr:CBS domain-containing protein [Balneolaceae bacterium]